MQERDFSIFGSPGGGRSGAPPKREGTNLMRMRIDISDLPTIVCSECESILWERCMVLKKLSTLQSPTGKDEIIPVDVICCKKCGKLLQPEEVGV